MTLLSVPKSIAESKVSDLLFHWFARGEHRTKLIQ